MEEGREGGDGREGERKGKREREDERGWHGEIEGETRAREIKMEEVRVSERKGDRGR